MSIQTEVKAVVADIAREIRANPAAWTQGRPARDSAGHYVEPKHPAAVCWCLDGHIEKRVGPVWEEAGYQVYKALMRAMPEPEGVETWNDNRKRKVGEVIELLEAVANG